MQLRICAMVASSCWPNTLSGRSETPGLGQHRRNAFCRGLRLARKMLLPRSLSIGAPCRHRSLAGALDPAVRVDSGGKA
jgi:hypothetical protein